jgi:Zn-dependent peptidase ImmA (M78 family)
MDTTNKATVLNPITLFNTVGQELKDILHAQNKDEQEFVFYIGLKKELSAIKKLSAKQITQISDYFNIEGLGSYLESFQEDYKETERKSIKSYREKVRLYSKLKKILPLLRNEFNQGMDVLEDIADFFNIENEEDIFTQAENSVALFRTPSFNPDTINLFAWMRRGELDFYRLNLPPYRRSDFELWIELGEWKRHLTDEKYFKQLPDIFRKFGVALVLTPYLEKTVYGAVRWLDGKPLIQISDRGKDLATCWYTLFHETGHVLLHENDTVFEGEFDTKTSVDRKEKEANQYADKKLFNGNDLRKYIFLNAKKLNSSSLNLDQIATKFNVDTIFVAYWMSKAQIRNNSVYRNTYAIAF